MFIDEKKVAGRTETGKLHIQIPAPVIPDVSYSESIAVNILHRGYPKQSASVSDVPDS